MNTVDRGGCRIAYRVSGNAAGPAVVFSHSLGLDHRSWDGEAHRLSDRYRVIQIDTRGHGRSGVPDGPYTLDEIGEDLIAVADRLGLDGFHHVGLSLGGLTGLWLAIHHPGRLTSATYCNTAARLGSEELWRARIKAVEGGMEAIADAVLSRFFASGFSGREPALFERVRQTLLSTDPIGYAGCCAALRDADLRPAVTEIDVPSLIIGGLDDVATPPAASRWLHESIPESELVLLEEAAHLSNLEQPAAFSAALTGHLERH